MHDQIRFQAGLAILMLGAVMVQADERYPAADFEPKVIYQAQEMGPDASGPTMETGAAATDAGYPAAYYMPRVIFQDPALIEATGPLAPPEAPKAQAASGRPPVVAAPTRVSRAEKPAGTISDAAPPYGILALVLGLIGLVFWWASREQKSEAQESPLASWQEHAATETAEGDLEDAEEELEELAAAAEETLATSNRQRANKTKRSRRR